MLTVETLPQQVEHFEWLNAIDFFHNYLDIIGERVTDLSDRGGAQVDRSKVEYFAEQLDQLRER